MAPTAPTPAAPRLQRKVTSGAAIKPVIPVVPTPPARPTAAAKEVQPDESIKVTEEPSSTPALPDTKASTDVNPAKEISTNTGSSTAPAPSKESKAKHAPSPAKTADRKQRPSKLNITVAKDTPKGTAASMDVLSENLANATRLTSEGSNIASTQLQAPGMAVSQVSMPPAARPKQSQTIRIPAVPKPEASSPGLPANTSKQASRRHSLTSIHPPDTPASERISDTISLTTTSRTNSPPPSKVGSAPVRHITKNQQKKERQARAKQAEQTEGTSKVDEPPMKVEEVQAPIVGRKKKTKKEKTQGTADSTPTVTRPTSPAHKEEVAEDKAAVGPVTPVKNVKKGISKVAADAKESETPSSPATPATGEQQKAPLTASSIFQSMLDAGDISASAKDIFNTVPGLNHRFETFESDFTEDNDSLVSDDQHRLLEQGEAVQIERSPNNHMVMFPDRRALQGLSAAQASRYLELRKQALVYGDVPSHQALDGLIPPPPPISVTALSSIAQRGSKTKKLSNKFQVPTEQPETTSMQKYGGVSGYGDESFLNRKPTMSLAEAERELMASRKETEGLEKKLNALLKKNRRLLFGNAH